LESVDVFLIETDEVLAPLYLFAIEPEFLKQAIDV